MCDIKGAEFKYAKTLTLDFFGSGMVDLSPGGAKRIKNSRKMQMVFFVFYGRVEVRMGTPLKTFSIGKGGQWQVPRGELFCSCPLCMTTRVFCCMQNQRGAQRNHAVHKSFAPTQNIKDNIQVLVQMCHSHQLRLHPLPSTTLSLLLYSVKSSVHCRR